jgi:hypothetical protein
LVEVRMAVNPDGRVLYSRPSTLVQVAS